MKFFTAVAFILFFVATLAPLAFAQSANQYQISGMVIELTAEQAERFEQAAQNRGQRDGEQRRDGERGRFGTPLQGANIALLSAADSSLVRGTTSGSNGAFLLDRVPNGEYILAATFVGFSTQLLPLTVQDENLTRVVIRMVEGAQMLEELQISALIPRVEVRGDTTAFNADAYRVNPDASAEDLVRRMPGFTVENGELQAQGEAVQRILVDGEEFFGDDATLALRNLPAEIIGSIELFDRRSDQARFTGFDDGNEERTVNIVTRAGRNNGQFGRGNLSAGTDNRYMLNGNLNFFNGSRRISILGMTNNVNQQNFTGADLEGVAAASQNEGGGGRGRMGGGRWGGGGGDTRNFMTGSQRGINTTHSLGINYIDRFGENTRLNSSYFFNAGDNNTNQVINRTFLTEADAGQEYNENSVSETRNYNHRFNARMEHTFNNRNSLIITPRATLMTSDSEQFQNSRTTDTGNDLNTLISSFTGDNMSYNVNNSALWRHNFEQRGRTLSVNVRNSLSSRTGEQIQNSESVFFDGDPQLGETARRVTDQSTEILTGSWGVSSDIQYTEPLREGLQLLVRFRPSVDEDTSERDLYEFDENTGRYDVLNPQLTNRYINRTFSHRTGTGLRYRKDAMNVNADVNYEYTQLDGEQSFPFATDTRNTYRNIVGSVNMNYRFTRTSNLSLNYRSNTRNPGISQLQDVVDNSNPLLLRGGNPNLEQQYSHNVTARFRTANPDEGTSWFGFVRYSLNTNTIGNRTFIATSDTLVAPGIILGRGGRLTQPDNIGNSWNIRSFFNHSRALPVIQSNINFNTGFSYSIQPTFNNDLRTEARNIGMSGGTSVSSNIGPNLDFNLSYRANYNIVDNASSLGIDNNYYTGNASGRVNLLPWGRLLLATDVNFTHYEGLDEDFDQSVFYWNAAVGFKFGPRNAAEVRLTIYDILGQNNSVNRFVNDGYVEDINSNVITRFALLSFSYNFRNFRTR